MRKNLPLAASIFFILAMAAAAQGDEKPIREIFVPFDDLNVLLEGDAQRVFLTRQEYEDLIEKAKQTPVDRAPQNAVTLSADYDTTIQDGRAVITGELRIEVLEAGLHAIPLQINGVGIRSATLDDEPASLGRSDKGQPVLFVEGVGQRRLELEMVTVLQTSAAQQSLQIALPTPAATQFRVSVPGNVEVRSGAAVINRIVDQEENVTQFELLPQRGSFSLVMSLNNRLLLDQRVVMARSVIIDEITQAYQRLHATVWLDVLHGAVENFRFRVPDGFEITEVDSQKLARWLVEEDDAGERIIDVALREPTTGIVELNISAINNTLDRQDWTMPRLAPLNVSNHVAVVGVLVEDRLASDSIATEGLIPIDNAIVRRALPESVFQADPGAPQVNLVVAFYAPEEDYSLAARFTKPPARVEAQTAMLLTLGEKEQHASGTLTLIPEKEKLFSVDVTVPAGWKVQSVTGPDGKPLRFEMLESAEGQDGRLQVKLPAGVAPGSTTTLTVEATSSPAGWLDEWSEMPAGFPVFAVANAANSLGAIAVETIDDLIARPDQLTGLTPLDDSERESLGLGKSEGTLAYRFSEPDYQASFVVTRLAPRMTARTFSFLKIDPEGLAAHYVVIYDVQQARARRLSFELPESTPATLSIKGLDDVQVKEYSSELLLGGQRQWTAQLADAARGQLRLAIDFEQPLAGEEPKDFELPVVMASDVVYQSSIVAVEGNPEFDIQVQASGRKIDVGELVDADHPVGRRLLGAFGFITDPEVTIDVFRRPGYGLPAAVTERAELVTLVSGNGRSQTAARYLLRTKAAYLQITLPPEASLWSATVDGKPSTPQRDGNDLVVSLPPTTDEALRDLQIVFEMQVRPVTMMADVATDAPRLAIRADSDGQAYEVPTADLEWHLVLPEGQQVVRSGGTVFTDDLDGRTSPVAIVGKWLYLISGGVGRSPFILSAPQVQATRATPNAAYLMDDVQAMQPMESAGAIVELGDSFEMDSATTTAEPAAEMPGTDAPQAKEETVDELRAMPQLAEGAAAVERDVEAGGEQPQRSRPQPGQPQSAKPLFWALQGVRSLPIEMQRTGDEVQLTYRSMGVEPRLQTTLIEGSRLRFLSWALAILVALTGVALTNRSAGRKARFVIEVLVLALAAPLVIGLVFGLELSFVFEPAFYAATWLVPYYLVVGAVKLVVAKAPRWRTRRAAAAASAALLAGLMFAGPSPAQENGIDAAIDPDDLLMLLQPGKPLVLPKDAVIIPYDPDAENALENAEKVLVPYAEYNRLWNLAFPDKPIDEPKLPAAYAFAGATYSATLDGGEFLLVTGQLTLDVFAEDPIEIPLRFQGGVFERATLDGQPARLRLISAQPPAANQQPQQAAQPAAADSLAVLYVSEPGRKQFELAVRLQLQRSGGWRIVRGRLPVAPATAIALTAPLAQTEVRVSGVHDRSAYETEQENETIETALSADGSFNLQWRPKVAAGQVDQSLTAQSTAVLDVQEDGVRLTWQVEFESRNSQRETFTLVVPAGYLVEKVIGDNVRGWQARDADDAQQVDITLLKAVTGKERITLQISRRAVVGLDEVTSLAAPAVAVPDAMLHQGRLAIRRGPLLDLRAEAVAGLSRAEIARETLQGVLAAVAEESPLVLRPFQSYRFATSNFSLQLSARAHVARSSVEEQSLLRIAERETTLETRFNFNVQNRTVHELRVAVPDGFELEEVTAPGMIEWAITTVDDQRLLTVYLAEGMIGSLALDLRGKLAIDDISAVPAPRFEVLDAARQSGYLVVQVDPSMEVLPTQLTGAETVLLDRVQSWLRAEKRQLASLAIYHRAADYGATFQVTPRQPDVSAFSVTNVVFTPREIEEWIFLQFTIAEAGIREVSFLLPAVLQDSEITVPLLRQKVIEPVGDDADLVRIRLELQEERLGQLRVLIKNSRSLSIAEYEAAIPTIETGDTDHRYVVIESAGRDEVVVTANDGLVELNRQLDQWKRLAEILEGNITQAYVAREDTPNPRLAMTTRERSAVETVGARIGLAQSLLIVDSNGAYRGSQEYQVDNKTEQFLEIELPEGAQLWTARVAGEAVKPTEVPNATTNRRVRIPLIKTQTGDLDYPVVLKYGGQLRRLSSLSTISFPLVKTTDIRVERSNVRLRLPDSHRWMNFAGTMKHVEDDGELTADFLSYRNKQVQQLTQIIRGKADAFSKLRAANNLKQLALPAHDYSDTYFDNARLQREILSNSAVVREAQKQLQVQNQEADLEPAGGNQSRLQSLYESQSNYRSKNVVNELDNNFDALERAATASGKAGFNEKWFRHNQRDNSAGKGDSQPKSRVAEAPAKAPAAKPKLELNQQFSEFRGKQKRMSQDEKSFENGGRGEISQIERYQQQLDAISDNQSKPMSGPATPAPQTADGSVRMEAMSGYAGVRNSRSDQGGGGQAARFGMPAGGGFGGGGMGGGAGGDTNGMPAGAMGGMPAEAAEVLAGQAPASGLASLDVALPQRGNEFLFTTPRGDIEITAQTVSADQVNRVGGLLLIVAGLVVIGIVYKLGRALIGNLSRRAATTLLIVLGIASLIFGVFPVLGLIALVWGIAMALRGMMAGSAPATATS